MPNGNRQAIVDELISRGREALRADQVHVPFTGNKEADAALNSIGEYPHLFVLGCIADRQMPAERAWSSAYQFCRDIVPNRGDLTFENVVNNIHNPVNVNHRFYNSVANDFVKAIERIRQVYQSNAGAIWANNPICASVVGRFLEFNGVGLKIANMATNILLRDFKIPMQNKTTIDMPVDGNVLRVFKKLGLVPAATLKREIVTYMAKALYPDYPAVFDKGAWEIGKNWCHANRRPECTQCYMKDCCPSKI